MATSRRHTDHRESFALRSAIGLVPTALAGLAFLGLVALVATRWEPLAAVDQAVVELLNDAWRDDPFVVRALQLATALGGNVVAWLALATTALWLLVRRQRDLAAYVVVTGAGAAILVHGIKEIVERARPVLDLPVITAAGNSFPSGHALTATTTYGVLALVFLPVVGRRWRRALVVAAALVAVLVGFTRVALGVHFPTDVVGGWLLGVLWLYVTATTFRHRVHPQRASRPLSEGLEPGHRQSLQPAPAHDDALPRGGRTLSELAVSAVLVFGVLVGLGFVVTASAAIQELDRAVVDWFGDHRTEPVSQIVVVVGRLGNTAVIIAVVAVAAALALAMTRRWRPALFVVTATAGEATLFLATQAVVGRDRPPLDRIDTGGSSVSSADGGSQEMLLQTTSFPSGHVAAALATYGAIALLCLAHGSGRWRFAVTTLAGLAVLGVAFARVYLGVHYPTDVLGSLVLASSWLAACWFFLLRDPDDRPT